MSPGRITGIVLAAGQSTRMGQLKQLLPLGDEVVIQIVVGRVSQCLDHVCVVLGYRSEEVARALDSHRATCVVNPDYASGMTSSIQRGVRAAADSTAYLLCLGDQPGIKTAIIDHLLREHAKSEKGLIIPTHKGKRGHPILVDQRYRSAILDLETSMPFNEITRGFPEDTLEITTDDPAILRDMDTPEDYDRERLIQG